MAIKINHQLQEQIPHDTAGFSVTFYCDELAALPNYAGPLHWHPYFEIATAKTGVLELLAILPEILPVPLKTRTA